MKIDIVDSTLRDGSQGGGISFSVLDKLKIIKELANFGIPFIEAGNPYSNPKDVELFQKLSKMSFTGSNILAFGATAKNNPAEDKNIISLLNAGTQYLSIVGKSSLYQVEKILGVTCDENLKMIYDTIFYLTRQGKKVFFDAEHFFDGYKMDRVYAVKTLAAAVEAGAEAVILCDTNGGSFPSEIYNIVKEVKIKAKIGIHIHNDIGCAVAASISAVEAGATQVQGTFLGIGERCGNANLCSIIPNLQLKLGYDVIPQQNVKAITKIARFVAETANIKFPDNMPYVGISAFAHKGGMHMDGMVKDKSCFEHIDPQSVGNERNFLLSEVSGRAAVLSKIREFDEIDTPLYKDDEKITAVTEKLKQLEYNGFMFESANASFELLVLKELGKFDAKFCIENYKVVVDKPPVAKARKGGGEELEATKLSKSHKLTATAMVKVKVGSSMEIAAAEGDGPVNAIDKALRRALSTFYPIISKMWLSDYKVCVISSGKSTASTTRVLIESTDGTNFWTTVGASPDIIGASVMALSDSLEYLLLGLYNKGDI